MLLLKKAYRSVPKPVREILKPLTGYFYSRQYRTLDEPLAGFKFSGRDAAAFDAGYEKNLVDILQKVVREGETCVDAGAHMGYITLLFAKLVGEKGFVYAFEAHPENAKQVAINVRQNGMRDRVKVENLAVSDGTVPRLQLHSGRKDAPAEWNIVGHDVEGNKTQGLLEVQAMSFDNYFSHSASIHVIKLDIEGAEKLALSGMKRLLSQQRPVLFIEFHDENGWSGREILIDANYAFYDINSVHWLEDALRSPRVYHCLAVPSETVETWKTTLARRG